MGSTKAQEMEAYLAEWLRKHKTAVDLAPTVEYQYRLAQWQTRAYDTLAPNEVRREVDPSLDRDFNLLKRHLPMPPQYHQTVALGTSTTSTSTMIVASLSDMYRGRGAPPRVGGLLGEYRQLQDDQNRIAEARERLERVFPSLVGLFDTAQKAVGMFRLDVDQAASAASESRNLLEKLKGELLDKARNHDGENMTWEKMAECLTVLRSESDHRVLLEQDIQRGRLYADLSAIAKRTHSSVTAVEMLWPRVVDHIYVVCGCLL